MKTALITGASSGIGQVFAQELAQSKTNLVLVARREDKLKEIAKNLAEKFKIQVDIFVQDLTDTNAAQNVFNFVNNKGIKIDLLINNAGFGDYGAFVERERERQLQMIQLNVLALVDLTYQFLPGMRERKSGEIINLASIAAFQPLPYLAVYAATKSFVLSFSEALWAENNIYGVKILAVCPGPTETEFFQEAKFPKGFESANPNSYTSPEEVVKESLKALAENKANIVTGGWKNQIIVNMSRFLPRETLVNTIEKQLKN